MSDMWIYDRINVGPGANRAGATGLTPTSEVTIVHGGHVLTMSDDGDHRDGAVALSASSGKILAVGPHAQIEDAFPDAAVVGDERSIVLPGFINGHDHLSEALISGLGETMSLYEWIERLIMPVIPLLDAEKARVGTLLKGIEMLHSGITCVNDMFVHRNYGANVTLGVVDGLEQLGLRGVVSFGADDLPGPVPLGELMSEHETLANRVSDSPLIDFRLGISTIQTMSDGLLQASVAAAREHGWGVHSHLAEVREELTDSRLQFGATTLERAHRSGLLDLDTVFAHCIWVLEPDIELLASTRCTVVHNPLSNMILGSGVCPVPRIRAAGIPVGLGTDGAASNDSHDMLQVIKCAPLLQKVHHLAPAALTARDALRMATLEGARALGLDEVTGSLEEGKAADVIRLTGESCRLAYVHDPYQQVAYSASPGDVVDVWVQGRRLLKNGSVQTVREAEVVRQARGQAEQLFHDAGLEQLSEIQSPVGHSLSLTGGERT
jgi:cytosine/adenosine deaminase-related metal-dependent hydrolase